MRYYQHNLFIQTDTQYNDRKHGNTNTYLTQKPTDPLNTPKHQQQDPPHNNPAATHLTQGPMSPQCPQ